MLYAIEFFGNNFSYLTQDGGRGSWFPEAKKFSTLADLHSFAGSIGLKDEEYNPVVIAEDTMEQAHRQAHERFMARRAAAAHATENGG